MKFPDNFAAKLEVLKIVLPWCDIFGFPLVAKAEVRCCHFTRNSIKSIIYCGNSVLKDFSLQCFYCIFINKTNLPVIFFFRTAFCVWFQLLKKGLCAPPPKKKKNTISRVHVYQHFLPLPNALPCHHYNRDKPWTLGEIISWLKKKTNLTIAISLQLNVQRRGNFCVCVLFQMLFTTLWPKSVYNYGFKC